jgi:mono/diheme cytochrome c family protein
MMKHIKTTWIPLLILLALPMWGCGRQDMVDQHRYEPLEGSTFFADGRSARPMVEGTVARGQLRLDDHLYKGRVDGKLVEDFPFPVTEGVLQRGRERYGIFCSPCHGGLGNGQGMAVRRGLKEAATFHSDRLRDVPVGYIFDVITNGFGVMSGYAHMVPVEDRWAIVSYVRALQLSQRATMDDIEETDLRMLPEMKPAEVKPAEVKR